MKSLLLVVGVLLLAGCASGPGCMSGPVVPNLSYECPPGQVKSYDEQRGNFCVTQKP